MATATKKDASVFFPSLSSYNVPVGSTEYTNKNQYNISVTLSLAH